MPAHIKSSMFGCALTYVPFLIPQSISEISVTFFFVLLQDTHHRRASQHGNLAGT
jgi:hypothetical protein